MGENATVNNALKKIIGSSLAIGLLLLMTTTTFAGSTGEVEASPLYQQSLQQSIAQIEGRVAPSDGVQQVAGANLPTGQNVCSMVALTQQSTCSSTYCGGSICSSTCLGLSTCSYTCSGATCVWTCGSSTCATTCAGTCANTCYPGACQNYEYEGNAIGYSALENVYVGWEGTWSGGVNWEKIRTKWHYRTEGYGFRHLSELHWNW